MLHYHYVLVRHADESDVKRIGKYDVHGELGQGGMAVVYRASDPDLDRTVAIKVLHPHLARDPECRARFEREARAAARLRHPNIVEVYEFSSVDEQQSYLVTELLDGPTLRAFVAEHPDLPTEVVAAIGVVLCDALSCAHRQGVVHRDVKPDNLLLSEGRTLKLTDFGIAHVADAREMTATGQVLGSPAHMAPEQIEGAAVDARTDIFAAGTVLYLLAVGKLPFDGPTPHALLRRILDGEYTDPLRARPVVGHRFAAIVCKAMAHDPDGRYSNAAALRRDLTDFLSDAGWSQPEIELERWLRNPEGTSTALRARLIEKLPILGQTARRNGDLPAAMGYFNRALALDPGNPKVIAMVRSVVRRREALRFARGAAIVVLVAVLTAFTAFFGAADYQERTSTVTLDGTPLGAHELAHTSNLPRVVVSERQRPPVIQTQVPTVAPTTVSVPRASSERRASRLPAQPAQSTAAAQAVTVTREVRLAPRPLNVMYSVGDGPQQPFSSRNTITLPVGRPATITVYPLETDLYDPLTWRGVIEPGDRPLVLPMHLHGRGRPAQNPLPGASP